LITDRMLRMFKRKPGAPGPKPGGHGHGGGGHK
jgi:hypothetical protein